MSGAGTGLSGRSATAFAGSATFVIAVGADVVAGGHPWHTATLGIVAAVIAVLRLRLAGRHRGFFAATSAALVAQPLLHAATTVFPATAEPFPAAPGHAAAEASVAILHVLIAALIVAAVAGAEQLFLLVSALAPFTRWLGLLLWRPRPQPLVTPPPTPAAPVSWWSFVAHIRTRGPPAAVPAAAV